MNMDDKLKNILKIRPLQNTVITFRTSTTEYRKLVKNACLSELKNLVNVEMEIEQVQVKIPDEKQMPPMPSEIHKPKIGALLKECSLVEEGINLL
ncbi:uncharacterized protein LOC109613133 [Musca domestica]|uniref:Uncharacterized protein LOC109613133 n=1 Tax=Musca domestica TaxID=7370 RepID=A0A9J7IED8_MUSDO|nr:uncharacterized protein LOC109613133 [Musca domestica]